MVIQRRTLVWALLPLLAGLFSLGLTSGCQRPSEPVGGNGEQLAQPAAEPSIRLLVIEDATLAEEIERQWNLRTARGLVVRQRRWDELASAKRLAADVVIYPAGYLGDLAERGLLAPVPAEVLAGPDVERRDLLPTQQQLEMVWGKKTMAFPFGSPTLVLYYRADILEALDLKPPATWREYQQLVLRLKAQPSVPGSADANRVLGRQPWTAALEPLATTWAGQLLLARAVAYAKHPRQVSTWFDIDSMRPRIDSEPFVRALEELAESQGDLPMPWRALDPAGVRALFHAGHCALALTWPSATGTTSDETRGAFRIAPLPGSDELFDPVRRAWRARDPQRPRPQLLGVSGRLGSVTWEADSPRAAADLLAWLTGPEIAADVSGRCSATTLFRVSHLRRPEQWMERGAPRRSIQDYADWVRSAQPTVDAVFSPRLPGRQRYLAALAQGVHYRLFEGRNAAECLAETARTWEQITDSLDRDKQRIAYRRSLAIQ